MTCVSSLVKMEKKFFIFRNIRFVHWKDSAGRQPDPTRSRTNDNTILLFYSKKKILRFSNVKNDLQRLINTLKNKNSIFVFF